MTQLTYSFCMSLLHSIWQAGLLWLLYLVLNSFFLEKNSPLEKRNILFLVLAAQVLLFFLTFSNYYTNQQNILVNWEPGILADHMLKSATFLMITPWLFTLYCFVLAYKMVKAFYTWYHFKKKYRIGLQKPPVNLRLFTSIKAYQFGINRKIKLWLSTTIHTPVTFGFLKPVIILPVALINNIDMIQAETLIVHELTHIKSNDYLLNWFLILVEIIFFFNPFITACCKKIRLEREKYCDISVIGFSYSPVLYAETLLQAERIKQVAPGFQLAAVGKKTQLLERIRFFTRTDNIKQPRSANLFAFSMGLLLIIFSLSTFFFRFYSANTKPASTTAIKYSPTADIKIPGSSFFKRVETNAGTANYSNELMTSIETKGPTVANQSIRSQHKEKAFRQNGNTYTVTRDPAFAVPVSLNVNDASRDIIINEEISGSNTVAIKVYRLSFENGQWVIKPKWIAIAKGMKKDPNWDSSGKKVLTDQ